MTLYQLYKKLANEIDTSTSWPSKSKIEIVLGAILVQNTNWNNVVLSLAKLDAVTALDPDKILQLTTEELEQIIKPSGFQVNKTKCIFEVLTWLKSFNYDFGRIKLEIGDDLRKRLINLRGIGDETADVLMLYVFDVPVFIADKYAQKLLTKLAVEGCDNYKKTAKLVHLTEDFTLKEAQDFHLLIIEFGKLYLNRGKKWEDSFLYGVLLKNDI